MNQLIVLGLTIAIMIFAGDLMTRGNARVNRLYRRTIQRAWASISRRTRLFVGWAWRNYRQGIIGVGIGILITLFFLGRLQ